jgi:hypothetical protein
MQLGISDNLIVELTDNIFLNRGFDFDQGVSRVLWLQQFKNTKTFVRIQMPYKLHHVRRCRVSSMSFFECRTVLLANMSFNVLDQLFVYGDCLKRRQVKSPVNGRLLNRPPAKISKGRISNNLSLKEYEKPHNHFLFL